jgi:DNA-binding MarR family transcriptional regulator
MNAQEWRNFLADQKSEGGLSAIDPASDPVLFKILAVLDKVGILTNKRIAEILNISRDGTPAGHKVEKLEKMGLIRTVGSKSFGIRRATNLWELTEAGKTFVADARKNKNLPKIRLSEMSGELKNICSEVISLLELPKSVDELDVSLKASGIKTRKYKLGDVLRVLEAAALIKKAQVRKQIKVFERLGITEVSDVPGGIVTYVKTEGADINSGEI